MFGMIEKMKKVGKPIHNEMEKIAKMSVLKNVGDLASEKLGEKLKGLKKVTVASDSTAGVKEGLDKAKAIVDEAPGGDFGKPAEEAAADVENEVAEGAENPAEEASESQEEEMTLEEVNQAIEALNKLKEKLSAEHPA